MRNVKIACEKVHVWEVNQIFSISLLSDFNDESSRKRP